LIEPRSVTASVAVGWLMAFPLSIAIAALVYALSPAAEGPQFNVDGTLAVVMLVGVSPVLETLIMGGVLSLLLRFLQPRWAILASAMGWGVAHSLAAPIWGLIIWWPFLIFSTQFVTWRQRSLGLALAVPMLTHALQNLAPALLIAGGVNI
jgi:hypothetical protein